MADPRHAAESSLPAREALATDSSSGRELASVFDQYRQRLRTVIEMRMDPRLKARVDPSDVLQETYLDAAARWDKYEQESPAAPYFWLRFLAVQRLLILHRRHLQAQNRDARREVPIPADAAVEVSSCGLAGAILDSGTSPSRALSRAEAEDQLQRVLTGLDANDREILALRPGQNGELRQVDRQAPHTFDDELPRPYDCISTSRPERCGGCESRACRALD